MPLINCEVNALCDQLLHFLMKTLDYQLSLTGPRSPPSRVICFPINAPGMGRFQLLNLGGFGYGLELRFWVVIAIIVSPTLTITLITILTII